MTTCTRAAIEKGSPLRVCLVGFGTPYLCMEWNAENQLVRILFNASKMIRYLYDPLGRRLEIVHSSVGNAFSTKMVYDGEDILKKTSGDTFSGPIPVFFVHGPASTSRSPRRTSSGASASTTPTRLARSSPARRHRVPSSRPSATTPGATSKRAGRAPTPSRGESGTASWAATTTELATTIQGSAGSPRKTQSGIPAASDARRLDPRSFECLHQAFLEDTKARWYSRHLQKQARNVLIRFLTHLRESRTSSPTRSCSRRRRRLREGTTPSPRRRRTSRSSSASSAFSSVPASSSRTPPSTSPSRAGRSSRARS